MEQLTREAQPSRPLYDLAHVERTGFRSTVQTRRRRSAKVVRQGQMELTVRHRILRRLAGRLRMDAMKMDDKAIAMKLVLMAIELEMLSEEARPASQRRN